MTYEFVLRNFANNLYVFFLLSTYKPYSGTKTDTEEKYKTKIEKQTTPMCRAQQTPIKMATRETSWERLPQKHKHSLHFVVDSQNLAHATKSGYNIQNVPCRLA